MPMAMCMQNMWHVHVHVHVHVRVRVRVRGVCMCIIARTHEEVSSSW